MTINIEGIQKLIGGDVSSLSSKSKVVVYDFYEPKGHVTISQAILTSRLYLNLIKCGAKVVLCVGNWIAHLNGRFGGDFGKIEKVSLYYIEMLKGLGVTFGENNDNVSLVFQKEQLGISVDYWEVSLDISQKYTAQYLSQISAGILKLKGKEEISASHILLPCHLVSNIFFSLSLSSSSSSSSSSSVQSSPSYLPFFEHLKLASPSSASSSSSAAAAAAAITPTSQSGSPPTVTTLISPEIVIFQPELVALSDLLFKYCEVKGLSKPIVFSQSVASLGKAEDFISPNAVIYIEEAKGEILKKINKAFFSADDMAASPLVNWLNVLVLPSTGAIVIGGKPYVSFAEIEPLIKDKTLSIKDFKEAIADCVDRLAQPVRAHFDSTPELKGLQAEAVATLDEKPEKKKKEEKGKK